jgi:hypothetical protein
MRTSSIALILAVCFPAWAMPALGLAADPWSPTQVFQTREADIVYDQRADLEELARRLGALAAAAPGEPDLGLLTDKIDGMLAEISRVLQKWPLQPVRLRIRLLRDGLQVQQQQLALRAPTSPTALPAPRPLESYYEPRLRTIFLSLADVRPGILAHEMTHFVLCEADPARSGSEYHESLARYMEDRFNAGK